MPAPALKDNLGAAPASTWGTPTGLAAMNSVVSGVSSAATTFALGSGKERNRAASEAAVLELLTLKKDEIKELQAVIAQLRAQPARRGGPAAHRRRLASFVPPSLVTSSDATYLLAASKQSKRVHRTTQGRLQCIRAVARGALAAGRRSLSALRVWAVWDGWGPGPRQAVENRRGTGWRAVREV